MNHTTLGISIGLAIVTLLVAGMNFVHKQRTHTQFININIEGSQKGPPGPKGDKAKGDKGDTGPQGPLGVRGDKGDHGD